MQLSRHQLLSVSLAHYRRVFLLAETYRNSCYGSGLFDYLATTSCSGQAMEATFPYDQIDANNCPANTERDKMKTALGFKFAPLPWRIVDLDISRAVTVAPTQIAVDARNSAFQGYAAGIVPCGTESSTTISAVRVLQAAAALLQCSIVLCTSRCHLCGTPT
jgi:hypothetical protein